MKFLSIYWSFRQAGPHEREALTAFRYADASREAFDVQGPLHIQLQLQFDDDAASAGLQVHSPINVEYHSDRRHAELHGNVAAALEGLDPFDLTPFDLPTHAIGNYEREESDTQSNQSTVITSSESTANTSLDASLSLRLDGSGSNASMSQASLACVTWPPTFDETDFSQEYADHLFTLEHGLFAPPAPGYVYDPDLMASPASGGLVQSANFGPQSTIIGNYGQHDAQYQHHWDDHSLPH